MAGSSGGTDASPVLLAAGGSGIVPLMDARTVRDGDDGRHEDHQIYSGFDGAGGRQQRPQAELAEFGAVAWFSALPQFW